LLKTLVIIPTYNERDNLPEIVAQALAQSDSINLLVVDDNSPDGTGELAERLKEEHAGRLDVLHREGKLGLGTAYIAGFKYGLARDYEAICEMDADFSHDPAYLPRLIAALEGGADLALGSRYKGGGGTRNWTLPRKFLSRGGSLYARTILGVPVNDLTGGFKAFKRATLQRLDLEHIKSNGYSFQIEVTYRVSRLGLKIVEVPIIFVDRRVGQSKMSRKIFIEAVLMVWKLRLGLV
jgi:dolichol-phosphate mannosyltransferase